MGRVFATFGGTTVLLAIGYATVVATNPQYSHWSITLLLILLILAGLGTITSGIILLVKWYIQKRLPNSKVRSNLPHGKLRQTLISARARAYALLNIVDTAETSIILGLHRHAYHRWEEAATHLKKRIKDHPEYSSLIDILESGQADLNTLFQSKLNMDTYKSKIDDDAHKIIRAIDEILDSQINRSNIQPHPGLSIRDNMDNKPLDFEIIWLEENFLLKGTHNDLHSYNSTDEKDKIALILRAKIRISTFKQINVQSIALKIGSREFPWDEKDVNVFGEPVTDEYQFEFPLNITRGKQVVRIKAIVDGKEYILPNRLIVDFPRKLN